MPKRLARFRHGRLAGACAAAALAGCGGIDLEEASREVDGVDGAIAALQELRPAEGRSPRLSVVRVERRPWLSLKRIEAVPAEDLPDYLTGADGITLTLGGRGDEDELVRRIEAATGIPVRFEGPRLSAGPEGGGAPAADEDTFALLRTDRLSPEGEVWTGPLDDLLDAWAEHSGYAWRYEADEERIVVVRSRAVAFQLHALSGEQSYETSTTTREQAEGGGASRATHQTVRTQARHDPWKEIEEQLENLTSGAATIQISEASGTVLVRGTARDVAAARRYLAYLNEHRLLPVTLSIHVYSVEIKDEADYQLGLAGAIVRLFGEDLTFSVSPTGGGIVRARGAQDSLRATVTAMSKAGKVARVLSADIHSLNGLPAQFYDLFKEAYLKERKTTVNQGGIEAELTTDTVSSGFAVSYTPQVTGPGEVLVRLVASVQDKPTFKEFGSGGNLIQLPSYGSRAVHLTQRLARGDTLLVTGFADRAHSAEKTGTFVPGLPLPGGGREGAGARTEQVLLVTAEVGAPLGMTEVPGTAL